MAPTAKEKTEFLKHFLSKHKLKNRESVWILNYLMNHDTFMEKVRFVEHSAFCPYAIMMSTSCINGEKPIRLWKDNSSYTDAEKIFHDVRLNGRDKEAIYIELKFKDRFKDMQYIGIAEENPHIPDFEYEDAYGNEVEKAIEHSIERFKIDMIMDKIDKALDENNREEFDKLVKELNDA